MHVNLMVDSGAFSVWTRGETVDLPAYIDWLLEHVSLFHSYVNLDVMPGRPGASRTPEQVEEAASSGWNNLVTMRKAKLEPIHVFHQGERRYWLEKMLGEGLPYIGLSPNITLPTAQRRAWLDEQFAFLCGFNGFPDMKVHGFGITAVPLIHRYPWATTDSSSWCSGGQRGTSMLPAPGEKGEPDYSLAPLVVKFSNNPPHNKFQFSALGKRLRDYVVEYVEREGFTIAQATDDYAIRCRLNLRFFAHVRDTHPMEPFHAKKRGFFSKESQHGGPLPVTKYRAFMVSSSISRKLLRCLRKERWAEQLSSYIGLAKRDTAFYVKTGKWDDEPLEVRKKVDKRKGLMQ